MTLTTSFLIDDAKADPQRVFEFCNRMMGAESPRWCKRGTEFSPNPSFANIPGQGFDALLNVYYGADGPLLDEDDEQEMVDGHWPLIEHVPHAYIEVFMDTTLGWRDELDRTCGQLHAGYVSMLGRWCEQNGWAYHWKSERSGQWFSNCWKQAAGELGRPEDVRASWFLAPVPDVAPHKAAHGIRIAKVTP